MIGRPSPGLWLLPGMDGSGALWSPLVGALGARDATLVRYDPREPRYDALLAAIPEPREPVTVIAESFGGPLAIRLAARSKSVSALVLIASFAVAPRPARWLAPFMGLVRGQPPRRALRAMLLGGERHPEIEDALVAAIAAVDPSVMRDRLREVARVDVRSEASAQLEIPVMWIHAGRDRVLGASAAPGHVIDGPHLLAQTRATEIAALLRAR